MIYTHIKNPLLLEGRKSEVRLYWLIASLDPLLVLLFKEGTVRLNSLPFQLDDFDNTLIHVTNVYQQKHHPDYDPSLSLKWNFPTLQSYLVNELQTEPDFIAAELMPRFNKYLSFVVSAAQKVLTEAPARGLFFGLYGADFILDDQLYPWLTEVQLGPGLSHDDPIKKRVVPSVLGEAVRIALEVQERKRNGMSLKHLDSMDGFGWMINTA